MLNVSRDRKEGVLDVDVVLGRGFKKLEAVLRRQLLPLLSADTPSARQAAARVRLVAEKNLVDRVGRVLLDSAHPARDAIERRLVGHVVDEQDSHRPAVVRGRDSSEALLAGRVPDLQLDALVVQRDRADLEVDPYRSNKRLRKGIIREAGKDAALADTGVPDE